jgi:AraC-like DNA-binding protein
MKESLALPPGCGGAVWHYVGNHFLRRRPHRHDELELNLVISGSARYLVGERRYDLARGTLIVLFPEQDHVLLEESADYAMWIVVISPALLRRACQDKHARKLLMGDPGEVFMRPLSAAHASRLGALFNEVAAAQTDADRCNAGLAYAVLSAWAAYHSADAAPLGIDVHPAVDQAARALRDESEAENMEALAERCGLSRSRLSRLFKQQAGLSLVEYRQRQCLRRFLDLYGSGHRLNLLDASLQAGFGSYAQFHRVFKRLMRQSPGHYRRQWREGDSKVAGSGFTTADAGV